MGASRRKKDRFFTAHPHCCFCGGVIPSSTIDHVPNRACFLGRNGPEGFEFPACDACQTATRLDEIAFSFIVRMSDQNTKNYDGPESQRAINGMANNHPNLLPNPYLSGPEKRRNLARLGMRKPYGMANDDIPMVLLPREIDVPIRRYTTKIVAALYYREKRRALPLDHWAHVRWGQGSQPSGQAMLEGFLRITPLAVQGSRTNMNIGDRFGYRYNKYDDPDVFAVIAQFGMGLIIAALVAPQSFAEQTDIPSDEWRPIAKWLDKSPDVLAPT